MRGVRPEQGALTKDNDRSRSEETARVVFAMVDGLNDYRIDDIGEFFADSFRWIGNAGCGVKEGLANFQEGWQRPFQATFGNKVTTDEARLVDGEWAAAFGRVEADHIGPFMGIAPTGRRVEIRYMDFWRVENGKIADNWVMVDFPHVMRQLGVDPFGGHGWERYDTAHKRNGEAASDQD